jgi:hypothetical protein
MMSDESPERQDLIFTADDYIALGNQQSQTSNDPDPKIAPVYNCRSLLKNVHIQDISVALALDPQVVN